MTSDAALPPFFAVVLSSSAGLHTVLVTLWLLPWRPFTMDFTDLQSSSVLADLVLRDEALAVALSSASRGLQTCLVVAFP